MTHRVIVLFLVGLSLACGSSSRRGAQVHALVEAGRRDADQLARAGQASAALRLARVVDRVDPSVALEQSLLERELQGLRAPTPYLGDLRGTRELVARPGWERVALWLPDRLLDLADLVSFEIAFGPGLWVDAHLSHAAQLSFGGKETAGVGWHEQRSLGLRKTVASGVSVFGLGGQLRYESLLGTTSGLTASGRMSGAQKPSDPYYRDLRDYWELGASAQLLIVGAEADLHPLEFFDFLAGLVGADPHQDDLADYRAWDPEQQMRLRLEALTQVASDENSLRSYAAFREQRAAQAEAAQPTDAVTDSDDSEEP